MQTFFPGLLSAEEYKVVFTYLPLRSQCLPKAAGYNVRNHSNILAWAENLKKDKRGFPSSHDSVFLNEVKSCGTWSVLDQFFTVFGSEHLTWIVAFRLEVWN